SQCLEHIIITENMIFGTIKETMQKPVNPELREKIQFSDEEILKMVTDRSEKYKAPTARVPEGKFDDADTACSDLKDQRKEMLTIIQSVPMEELRDRVNESPSGVTDAYQSLLFLAGHTARHTLQIEEIKESSNFPE